MCLFLGMCVCLCVNVCIFECLCVCMGGGGRDIDKEIDGGRGEEVVGERESHIW